jgi:uncharacterized protein
MSAATILTLANGAGIDLLDPKPEDIDFNVVAEHLAKEKRYNGATRDVEYSVAEHCVRGANAILVETEDATLAAYFLLHDAHEHTIKDDTTPKKRALAELAQQRFGVLAEHVMETFKLLEYRQDVAIHEAAGLAWPPPSPALVSAIKRWDLIMFVTEWRDLMAAAPHPNWKDYQHVTALEDRIGNPWPWQTARSRYLAACYRLLPALKNSIALVPATIEHRGVVT